VEDPFEPGHRSIESDQDQSPDVGPSSGDEFGDDIGDLDADRRQGPVERR
jgi:hypothetical protein